MGNTAHCDAWDSPTFLAPCLFLSAAFFLPSHRKCLCMPACIHIQYCVIYKAEHTYNTIQCHISLYASTGSRSSKLTGNSSFCQPSALKTDSGEGPSESLPRPVYEGSTRCTSLQCSKISSWVDSFTQKTRSFHDCPMCRQSSTGFPGQANSWSQIMICISGRPAHTWSWQKNESVKCPGPTCLHFSTSPHHLTSPVTQCFRNELFPPMANSAHISRWISRETHLTLVSC